MCLLVHPRDCILYFKEPIRLQNEQRSTRNGLQANLRALWRFAEKLADGTASLLDYLMDNEPCQTIIRLAFGDNSPNVQWRLVVANCNSLR